MPEIGLFVSSEEHPASALVQAARQAEEAHFRLLLVSDHYHPWLDEQGHSPFVWSVLGAVAATTSLTMTTGVTCPTVRIHPAVIAQAAATVAEMAPGRFRFGIGSGEALNEHILGDHWPPTDVRLEMLEESMEVLRLMWDGGIVTHHGRHYTVENARIYEKPMTPIPLIVSGFGPKAVDLATRVADGFITVEPDAEVVSSYKSGGGDGLTLGALKVCWAEDEAAAVKLAHTRWRNEGLPGELAQTLTMPAHFEQASSLVTEQMIAESIPCGPDPERHVEAIKSYIDAGFDEIYVSQIGDDMAGFFDFFTKEVRPRLGL